MEIRQLALPALTVAYSREELRVWVLVSPFACHASPGSSSGFRTCR